MEPLSTKRLWWTIAGTWLGGFVTVMGAGLAVLYLLLAAVIGGLGGGLTKTDELTALGILAAGLVIGCPLLVGGIIALRAQSWPRRALGARIQVASVVLVLILLLSAVVRFGI